MLGTNIRNCTLTSTGSIATNNTHKQTRKLKMTTTTILIIGAIIVLPLAWLALKCAAKEDEQMRKLRTRIEKIENRLDADEEGK